MIKLMKVAIITGVLTLGVAALAVANGHKPETVPPENTHTTTQTTSGPNYAPEPVPGPKEGLPTQAKAYGRICGEQEASKQHVAGEQGTPFSNCVKNMAQAHKHPNMSAHAVCKDQTKNHAKGEESPFRACIKGVRQLRREEHQHS